MAATDLLYLSSSAIVTHDLFASLEQLAAITGHIELSGGNLHDAQLLQRLISFKESHDASFLIHNYFPPPEEHFVLNFADTSAETRRFITGSMAYVTALNVPYYSVHAGFRNDFRADSEGMLHRKNDQNFSVKGIIENAAWFASRWPDTPLALENIYPNNQNVSCAFMMSVDEISEVLDLIPDALLLLDLGHLKVSAQLMGFDYYVAVDLLFARYGNRIVELHLSENDGVRDDHYPITVDSDQHRILIDRAAFIKDRGIRMTIEARGFSIDELAASYRLVLAALG